MREMFIRCERPLAKKKRENTFQNVENSVKLLLKHQELPENTRKKRDKRENQLKIGALTPPLYSISMLMTHLFEFLRGEFGYIPQFMYKLLMLI